MPLSWRLLMLGLTIFTVTGCGSLPGNRNTHSPNTALPAGWAPPGNPAAPNPTLLSFDDLPSEIRGPWDILAGRVVQVTRDTIQLDLRTREPLPGAGGSRGLRLRYIWFCDTDRSRATGQQYQFVGSDYNVRVDFSRGKWTGNVDRIHPESTGGGPMAVFAAGDVLSIRLPLGLLGGAREFDLEVETVAWRFEQEVARDFTKSSMHLAVGGGDLPRGCVGSFVVVPRQIVLAHGTTRVQVGFRLFGQDGSVISAPLQNAEYGMSDDSLARIEGTTLKADPHGAGRAELNARISGLIGQPASVRVGEIELYPAMVHLALEGQPEAGLGVRLRNASDAPIEMKGRAVTFRSSNPDAVGVSRQGRLSARRADSEVTLTAQVDGQDADNASMVTVRDGRPMLPPIATLRGRYVVLNFWPEVRVDPAGPTVAESMAMYDAPSFADVIYLLESQLAHARPSAGAMQHFVQSVRDEASLAHSGNPVVCCVEPDLIHGNMFVDSHGVPQFGVWAHEMGHNSTLARQRFAPVFGGKSNSFAWVEGLASVWSVYSIHEVLADPRPFNLPARTVEQLSDWYRWATELSAQEAAEWAAKGKDQAGLHTGVVVRMVVEAGDSGGWDKIPGVFAYLWSDDPLPFEIATIPAQTTFVAASYGAAFGRDMRTWFRDRWGFVIDDSFYDRALAWLTSEIEAAQAIEADTN